MPSKTSRSVSIKVNVVPNIRPTPTLPTPASPMTSRGLPASPSLGGPAQSFPKSASQPRPRRKREQVAERIQKFRWPWQAADDQTKRRWMWSLVTVCMVMIVGGWVSLLKVDFQSGPRESIWSKVRGVFQPLKLKKAESTGAEQEIRQLDEQVFPDLSQ